MDLVWLVSSGQIDRMLSKDNSVNVHRYNAFVSEFGCGNIGLVEIDKLYEEINKGIKAPVTLLGKDLELYRTDKKGISSSIFLASGFDMGNGKIIKRDNLEKVMDYLSLNEEKGNIGKLINSRTSTLNEDKISFVGLNEEGFPVPKTYNFHNFNDFSSFIKEEGKHVVKHRFGYDGRNNFLIGTSNLDLMREENIRDYVVQELLPIDSETRMIFIDGNFYGARIINDRTRPWEDVLTSSRSHEVLKYSPSEKEIEDSRKMFKYFDGFVGAIDSVKLEDGTTKVLEFNGVGTGLGYPGSTYDLNSKFAKLLKEKCLTS